MAQKYNLRKIGNKVGKRARVSCGRQAERGRTAALKRMQCETLYY